MIKRLLMLVMLITGTLTLRAVEGVMDPTEYNKAVDFSKIRFWVGEGSNQAAFVLKGSHHCMAYSSSVCVDNIVYGYRWEGEAPTLSEMAKTIADADPFFYKA